MGDEYAGPVKRIWARYPQKGLTVSFSMNSPHMQCILSTTIRLSFYNLSKMISFSMCCRLNVYAIHMHEFVSWNSNFQHDGIWRRVPRELISSWGWNSHEKISALQRRCRMGESLLTLFTIWGNWEEGSPGTQVCWHSGLRISGLQNVRNKHLLFKPLSS